MNPSFEKTFLQHHFVFLKKMSTFALDKPILNIFMDDYPAEKLISLA